MAMAVAVENGLSIGAQATGKCAADPGQVQRRLARPDTHH